MQMNVSVSHWLRMLRQTCYEYLAKLLMQAVTAFPVAPELTRSNAQPFYAILMAYGL